MLIEKTFIIFCNVDGKCKKTIENQKRIEINLWFFIRNLNFQILWDMIY